VATVETARSAGPVGVVLRHDVAAVRYPDDLARDNAENSITGEIEF